MKPSETSMAERSRLLALEGGRNFRDFGGYPTRDGRRVRWGMLYRSGTMHRLTDTDYRTLSALGIRVICDFRTTAEREREPTVWRAEPAADYVAWEYGNVSANHTVLRRDIKTATDMKAVMTALYREFPETFKERFAGMFHRLAAGDVPLAINCHAGKDRTGVAAALILSALGVPRETVLADYALTNQHANFRAEYERFAAVDANGQRNQYAALLTLPVEAFTAAMRADPEYLAAALGMLDRTYGSPEDYVRQELGIGQQGLSQIRTLLLEEGETTA